MIKLVRSALVALALLGAAAPGCSKDPEVTAENITDQGSITEQHDSGAIVWTVKPDGQVMALLKGPDGKPLAQGVTGTLTVKPKEGAPVTAALVPVEKAGGVISAKLPPLEGDLTEMSYTLVDGGKPIQGTLFVPKGGTQELIDSAKAADEAKLDGKKGPNGGVLQVVGEDTLELVADEKSGAVRVYLLDDNLAVAKPGDRKLKIKLALNGDGAEVVELAPNPEGVYFEGKLNAKLKPKKITVVVVDGDVVHTAICGHHPGQVIVIGVGAPVIAIFINTVKWHVHGAPVVVVNQPGPVIVIKGKGKGKGKGKWFKKKGGIHVHF
ncbi:hypothetical protein [Chondromyces apiculatus]|uniref:Lipoprotein n=1 Tax=Chondromyces apiculatus DSM 436 TaxID=1192034 RepID=A0A017T4T2_9BACT|nr:hypothetical protein [Chondromyces apiculatus]EYF04278.1 Hypothetical protein CAP_4755 [Chondromyces apiculatus DSM 436]